MEMEEICHANINQKNVVGMTILLLTKKISEKKNVSGDKEGQHLLLIKTFHKLLK